MTPTPYDPPFRWTFESSRTDDDGETFDIVHLVDLLEGPDGECTCEDHVCRKRRCKHITAARDHLIDLILAHERTRHTDPDGPQNSAEQHRDGTDHREDV